MARGDGYDPRIAPDGGPQLSGVSIDAAGAIGASIAGAGRQIQGDAARAHHIETQQARESSYLGFQRDLATATADNRAYVAQRKLEAPESAEADGRADLEERLARIMPADPHVAQRAETQAAGLRADLAGDLDTWNRARLANQQALDLDAAGSTWLNGIAQAGSPSERVKAMERATEHYGAMIAGLGNLDEQTKRKAIRGFENDATEMAVRGALTAGDVTSAGALLDSDYARDTLQPERMAALYGDYRVTLDRLASQAKAAAAQGFSATIADLDQTAQDYSIGRPSYDEAQALGAAYEAAAAGSPTPEGRATATRKAKDWAAKAVELGAAERYRGASPAARDARIQELAARETLTPAEGAELRGLRGQAGYVASLPALGRQAYATGQAAAPIDWSDPASIRSRTALWQAARRQYGGAPDFLLPGEEAPLREIVRGGTATDKVAAMRTVMSLPGPAAARVLDAVAGEDRGFRAAATLARFADGGERMQRALQGQEAQRAIPTLWQRQEVVIEKGQKPQPVGPTRDEAWAALTPALAGLPAAYVADLRENTLNLYAASAKEMGWHAFRPEEMPRQLRFALGGGRGRGGIGTHEGADVVLPRNMDQAEFDRRIARASGDDWGRASVAGPPVMAGGRVAYTGELRGWVPVMVDPERGLYAMRQGNAYVQAKSGRPFLFDIHRLP